MWATHIGIHLHSWILLKDLENLVSCIWTDNEIWFQEAIERNIAEYVEGLEPIPVVKSDKEWDSSDCEASEDSDSSSGSESEVFCY